MALLQDIFEDFNDHIDQYNDDVSGNGDEPDVVFESLDTRGLNDSEIALQKKTHIIQSSIFN